MARNALPAIAVKEELALRRLKLPTQLDANIGKFAEFYSHQTGGRTPDESAVIVGILKNYLDGNSAFQQYLKDERRLESTASKRPAASATGNASSAPPTISEATKVVVVPPAKAAMPPP